MGQKINRQLEQSKKSNRDVVQSYLIKDQNVPMLRGHTATYYQGQIVIFGGVDKQQQNSNQVHIYNIKQRQWRQEKVTGEIPTARRWHTATLVDQNQLLVIGGYPSQGKNFQFNLLEKFWKQLTSIDFSNSGHSATLINNRIYLFGGYDRNSCCKNDLYAIDINSLTLERILGQGKCPTKRSSHGAVAVGNDLCIFGGVDNSDNVLNDLLFFNTQDKAWKQCLISQNIPGRYSFNFFKVNNKLFLFGGLNQNGKTQDDCFTFSLKQLCWSKVAFKNSSVDQGRYSSSATIVGGNAYIKTKKAFIIGGGLKKDWYDFAKDIQVFDFGAENIWWSLHFLFGTKIHCLVGRNMCQEIIELMNGE